MKKILVPLLALILLSGCQGGALSSEDTSTENSTVSLTSDTSIEGNTLSSSPLGKVQTINELQTSKFGKSGLPSIGDIDVLVVPLEIKGTAFPTDYKSKLEMLFNGTSEETGWESVASYYTKSSYGMLNLNFDIIDKYTTTQTKRYYESSSNSKIADQLAVAEALNKVTGVDYSKYDFNGDGQIDSVIYIYSVDYSVEEGSPWWAWVYTEEGWDSQYTSKLNGKTFNYYMWASYSFMTDKIGVTTTVNAETYIHEFGHLLGFPDYYSTTYTYGPLGDWDMMDYNTGDHGPFNKLVMGWIDPELANEKGKYNFALDRFSVDNDGSNNTIIIPGPTANLADGDAFDEYLLIMYYTPEGLYRGHLNTSTGVNGSGVVVYRVNAKLLGRSSIDFWDFFAYNNQGSSDFLVEILEADLNNSFPSNTNGINKSDFLVSGTLDLSSYKWSNNTAINVKVAVNSLAEKGNISVTLN